MSRLFRKQKESSLHLTDKHHPPIAIGATLLAMLSAVLFGSACFTSGKTGGHAGIIVGFLGMISMCICIIGFVMAWISLHQDEIRPLFPTIAALFNGLLLIFYLLIYVWGTVV